MNNYQLKVFSDNIKLERVYKTAVIGGDTALADWALKQLQKRGVQNVEKS